MPSHLKCKDPVPGGYKVRDIAVGHGTHYLCIEQRDRADDSVTHRVVIPLGDVHKLIAKLVKEVQHA